MFCLPLLFWFKVYHTDCSTPSGKQQETLTGEWPINSSPPGQEGTRGLFHWSWMDWARGGYFLCDGWYIYAAVLTPFFHFGRIEHDLFGVFFSSTNSKAIFWGIKTTNFYKNRSFWPQIQFFPRSFWVQFSAASGTPPSVFRPSTPPPRGTEEQQVSQSLVELNPHWNKGMD